MIVPWPACEFLPPKEELKLAGHPVSAPGSCSLKLGVVPAQEGGCTSCSKPGAGVLPVEIRFKDGRRSVSHDQTPAVFQSIKINRKELAAAWEFLFPDFHSELEPQYVSHRGLKT